MELNFGGVSHHAIIKETPSGGLAMFNLTYDDKQRIAAIIILAISFFFPLPFLGIISGIYLLRQNLPIGFKIGAVLVILEQFLIYVPAIAYLMITR